MTLNPIDALRELRALVTAYLLEGNADRPRAVELLDALEGRSVPVAAAKVETSNERRLREERECEMFGCAARRLDEVLASKDPRGIAMFATGTLSDAQALIRREEYGDDVEWTVADRHANNIRQRINVAKYAIDKAVPR